MMNDTTKTLPARITYEVICNYSDADLKNLGTGDMKRAKDFVTYRLTNINKLIGVTSIYEGTEFGKRLKTERRELNILTQRLKFT